MGLDEKGNKIALNGLWRRRQTTKFNGASYLTQRAAEALYTEEGQRQVKETIDYYLENARMLREGLAEAGYEAVGGINSPYIWLKTPGTMTSWEFLITCSTVTTLSGLPAADSDLQARAISG